MSEDKKEKWTQWVALTTTILAVCTAITSLKAGGYSSKVQFNNTKEANAWAYFQAKSIKQHTYVIQMDNLQLLKLEDKNPKSQDYIDEKLKVYAAEIKRYDKEKSDIQKEAENYAKGQADNQKHSSYLGLAVMMLQVAITLSAIGALIKRKQMWYVGLVVGVVGLVYMANGFLLWF